MKPLAKKAMQAKNGPCGSTVKENVSPALNISSMMMTGAVQSDPPPTVNEPDE